MLFHRSHPCPLLWVMSKGLFSCYSVSVERWQERPFCSQSQIYLLPDLLWNKCAYLCSRVFIDHTLPIHFCSKGCRASHVLPNILKSTKNKYCQEHASMDLSETFSRTRAQDRNVGSQWSEHPHNWLPSIVTPAHTAVATLSTQPLTLLRCLLLSGFIDIK